MSDNSGDQSPWYAGKNQDTIFYLLIAVFFIEMIVGGISFFYGIIHAQPEMPGGPPVARFPWLYWALSAILAPVGLLLLVHLTGSILSSTLKRDGEGAGAGLDKGDELPEGMRRFYASVRHAPTIVILLAILLLGAALFFMDGAFAVIARLFENLVPYIPWLVGSLAALLAVCFITHAIMVYRQRKLENEYAWRREVLEKTGLVITDKGSQPLSIENMHKGLLPSAAVKGELPETSLVLDVKANDHKKEDGKDEETEEKP